MNLFLKLKHWMLFIPLCGIPLGIQYYFMNSYMYPYQDFTNPQPIAPEEVMANVSQIFQNFKYFGILYIFLGVLHFCWIWSVGVKLQPRVPAETNMKITKFKVIAILSFIYMFVFVYVISLMMEEILTFMNNPDLIHNTNGEFPLKMVATFGIMFPLHLAFIAAAFYLIYFVAKTIKSAEEGRKLKSDEFIGEFVLIMVFPIGVWMLQPRINKLAENL